MSMETSFQVGVTISETLEVSRLAIVYLQIIPISFPLYLSLSASVSQIFGLLKMAWK